MSYFVAIPSYKRPDQLYKKTLNTLKNGNVPIENIYIFVIAEEEQLYKEFCPGYNIIVGVLGLVQQRKFIQSYFPLDSYIVMIDDDITYFGNVLSEKEKESINSLTTVFSEMTQEMKKENCFLCGIYPCDNLLFSSNNPKISTNFRFVVGAFFVIKNTRDPDLQPSQDLLEDTERTVLYWNKYKKILRFNHIIIKTKYFGKGGLETENRVTLHSNLARNLQSKYPELLFLKKRKAYKQNCIDAKCRRLNSKSRD